MASGPDVLLTRVRRDVYTAGRPPGDDGTHGPSIAACLVLRRELCRWRIRSVVELDCAAIEFGPSDKYYARVLHYPFVIKVFEQGTR